MMTTLINQQSLQYVTDWIIKKIVLYLISADLKCITTWPNIKKSQSNENICATNFAGFE